MPPGLPTSQDTTTRTVPPGRETGIYHIPVSNLPWNTTWHELKDFVRTVCTVDHVETFPGSTSGWIRVRGRENFKAAIELLNGGNFNGRALVADGKNDILPIVIKDLKLPPQSSHQPLPPPPMNPQFTHSVSMLRPDAQSFSPAMTETSTYIPWTPTPFPGYPASPPMEYTGNSAAQLYPTYAVSPAMSQPGPPMMTSPLAQTYLLPAPSRQFDYCLSSESSSHLRETLPATGNDPAEISDPLMRQTRTERRKIFIRNLSHNVNENQIHNIVRDFAGAAYAEMIVDVELRRVTAPPNKPSTTAFVLFSTEDAALWAVSRMDGREIGKRTIVVHSAEPVIIGADRAGEKGSSMRGGGHHQQAQRHDDKKGERKGDRKKDKDRSSKPSSSSSSSRPTSGLRAGPGPVIARSSGATASSSADKAGKDRSRNKSYGGDKVKEEIIIADGSSRNASPTDPSNSRWPR